MTVEGFNKKCLKETIVSVFLGQLLSLCLCGTAIASQFLSSNFHVDTPTAQSFANYVLLCLIYGTTWAYRWNDETNLIKFMSSRGWKYAVLALIDVEANYFVVKAYQYTNLTSVQILDCFTIPIVLILSFVFLSTRYRLTHSFGVVVCLLGIGCLIWQDILYKNADSTGGENKFLGDILCLCGAALYGVGNVGEEYFVKNYPRMEYLGMIGLFGSVISGIQVVIVERVNLSIVVWENYEIFLHYFLFSISMFTFYSLVTVVMQRTSATLFNLSILTADFYALIVGKFVFNIKFHPLYFLSFVLILSGSIVYSIRPTLKRIRPGQNPKSSNTNAPGPGTNPVSCIDLNTDGLFPAANIAYVDRPERTTEENAIEKF